jgi:hypothetical protein
MRKERRGESWWSNASVFLYKERPIHLAMTSESKLK